MHELVRTNNAVLITAIEALLKSADIPHMVLDQHMSVLEGSLGMLPRRIVVDQEYWEIARQLLELLARGLAAPKKWAIEFAERSSSACMAAMSGERLAAGASG